MGLAGMFGLAILVVALLEYLVGKVQHRLVILSFLTAISIGWHLDYTNDYRWAWQRQLAFYQQLVWRAPEIAPNTMIFSHGEFLSYMGDYPLTFAINAFYPQPEEKQILYWYLDAEDYGVGSQIEPGFGVEHDFGFSL